MNFVLMLSIHVSFSKLCFIQVYKKIFKRKLTRVFILGGRICRGEQFIIK